MLDSENANPCWHLEHRSFRFYLYCAKTADKN
jgi:hypothetical protein